MLNEALVAAELLARPRASSCASIVMPWLDRVDPGWLVEVTDGFEAITVARGSRAGGRARRRASSRARSRRRSAARWRDRRRGLARLRHASRGAAPSRPRRRVARRADRCRASGVSDGAAPARGATERPVWLVLADPLSTRVLVESGVVYRLVDGLGERLQPVFLLGPEAAAPWQERISGGRPALHFADDLPARGAAARARPAPDRPLARPAARLLPARDPPQPPTRVPSRADGARPPQRAARLLARRAAAASEALRRADDPLALLDASPRLACADRSASRRSGRWSC